MSWFSRLFVLPKDLNSGGDYVRKYATQIDNALTDALVAKSQELDGMLDAQAVTDYVLSIVRVPSWAKLMLQMLLYGVLDKAIKDVTANMGRDKVDAVVDGVMRKLKALK